MSLIIPANTLASGGFAVANSCRFNRGSSDYLDKTFSGAGSRTTWTISVWVKRANEHGTNSYIIDSGAGNGTSLYFGTEQIEFWDYQSGSYTGRLTTNRVFRDLSAWYHIVAVWDTTNGTAGDRMRLYVNGVEETSFATDTNPSSSQNSILNDGSTSVTIGRQDSIYTNLYMAEFCYIDGQALDPTSFGEFDSDSSIWKPIDVSGLTFGTNGFYLDFESSGSLGADVSGNGNDFTVNNLTAIDQTTDTPTNNGNTFQPLDLQASTQTLAEGNLKVTTDSGGDWDTVASTIGVTSGKWYFEAKLITLGTNAIIGVIDINDVRLNTTTAYYIGQSTAGCGYQNNGTRPDTGGGFGDSYTNNDIVGAAIDMDNLKVYFSKNGTFQNSGDPTSGATGTGAQDLTANTTYCFAVSGYSSTVWEANFGSPPYAISSGNTDGNGYGNFEYAVPSGYLSLCTANLSEVLG
jgi:hypothetical protein